MFAIPVSGACATLRYAYLSRIELPALNEFRLSETIDKVLILCGVKTSAGSSFNVFINGES